MVAEHFISYIEERMQERGHSLRRVAQDAGMSPSSLSRILTGERGLPANEALLNLGRALNVDPPEQVLIHAGRIPTATLDRLSDEEVTGLYDTIRDFISRQRAASRSSQR